MACNTRTSLRGKQLWDVLHSLGRANVLARQGAGRGLTEHWAGLKYCQALTGNDGRYMALSTEGRNPRRH
ncbi:hypothetical protein AB0B78_34110 [Streptomyces sp. NPDC040724]|uniref:hypothetical protein n=1 Tax=Streptomyces sp. NPDC040724 TaxID=3155612 RepID=UPI0033C21123